MRSWSRRSRRSCPSARRPSSQAVDRAGGRALRQPHAHPDPHDGRSGPRVARRGVLLRPVEGAGRRVVDRARAGSPRRGRARHAELRPRERGAARQLRRMHAARPPAFSSACPGTIQSRAATDLTRLRRSPARDRLLGDRPAANRAARRAGEELVPAGSELWTVREGSCPQLAGNRRARGSSSPPPSPPPIGPTRSRMQPAQRLGWSPESRAPTGSSSSSGVRDTGLRSHLGGRARASPVTRIPTRTAPTSSRSSRTCDQTACSRRRRGATPSSSRFRTTSATSAGGPNAPAVRTQDGSWPSTRAKS